MNDIMDLIYKVFDEIKGAEEEENFKLVEGKKKELDSLREELVKASNTRGSRILIPEKNYK